MAATKPNFLLFLLVFSQFAGTSIWFAGNAVIDQLAGSTHHASVTSFVQFGFIAGTLVFALFTVADRFSARNVFLLSCLLAALANSLLLMYAKDVMAVKASRFFTGFFLAGIYPVGMKIAADVFPERLGKALGLLVGALVLGTSFPHLVRSQLDGIHWEVVILLTSALAVVGGLLVRVLFPAPDQKRAIAKADFAAAFRVFRSKPFRAAAFGYFGHMWELYAFWSLLPLLFAYFNATHQESGNVYWGSFLVIAIGGLGCAAGGLLSHRWGSKRVAFTALSLSGVCCVLFPFLFRGPVLMFYGFLLFWGFTVTADSPQFSALVARETAAKTKGTALTIVTSIGFAITIISILLLKEAFDAGKEYATWLLAPGPLLGVLALKNDK